MITQTVTRTNLERARRALKFDRQPTSRVIILLEVNSKVRQMLPGFEQYLKVWDLKLVNLKDQKKEGIIELTIDAQLFAEVRWVTNLAYDFFKTAVIEVKKR
jgi:hypothetical protein